MDLLQKCVVTVIVTWTVRALAGWTGPRWGGLILGLPCSTAIMLLFLGSDRGADFAARAAHSGLLGLVGAMAVALVYARQVGQGLGWAGSLSAAVAAYLAVAGFFWGLNPESFVLTLFVSLVGVLGAMSLTTSIALPPATRHTASPSRWRPLILRTTVPIACVVIVTQLAESLGVVGSGLLSTFPATFVAVLVLTHVENSPRAAGALAQAFPQGNLSMIAFLGVFRWSCATWGLPLGLGVAYAAAVFTLVAVEAIRNAVGMMAISQRFAPKPA